MFGMVWYTVWYGFGMRIPKAYQSHIKCITIPKSIPKGWTARSVGCVWYEDIVYQRYGNVWHGFGMVLSCFGDGLDMVRVWFCHDFGMASIGFNMILVWFWYGLGTVLP